MTKASDKLILCGSEKIIDEKGVIPRYPTKNVLRDLERQDAILDGWQGSHLWVVHAGDGRVLEKHKLPVLPVWDGMATVHGGVYLATSGGVLCLAGEADVDSRP